MATLRIRIRRGETKIILFKKKIGGAGEEEVRIKV
jgi:hypothetical protein